VADLPRLIFDAHLDMAWNALEWNRNLELPVEQIRQFERQFQNIVPGAPTVSWQALRAGRVGLTVCTLLPRLHRKDKVLTHYQSREAAYAACCGQLAYYRALVAKGVLREISNRAALADHVNNWLGDGAKELPIGFILSMEGSPSVLSPAQIADWFQMGLRILGPSHYGVGPYSHGTGSEGVLFPQGRELLREMDRVGMLLDTTHLADQSFWEALEVFQGPVLASHHNCRALVPGDRQLTDEQIKALIARGAVIGAAFDAWMLVPGWKIGVTTPEHCTLEDVVNHIDHVCQLAGNARHAGLGTDLDGGFGKEQTPRDLDTIADLYKIAAILSRRGYAAADIDRIMQGNFVEFFSRSLPA
jgi:membrane dipeptidase